MLNKKYENKTVAFLDILGFKTLNLEVNKDVFKIMHYFQSLKDKNYDPNYEFQKNLDREVTILSDSIVISEKINTIDEFFAFLFNILYIQKHLSKIGIFLRGGISEGKIYHKNDIVFGPAMVEAHLLEDSVALYPRVIVIDKTVDKLIDRSTIDINEDHINMLEYLLEDYNEVNQIKYIDYLGCLNEYNSVVEYLYFLENIKTITIKEYKEAKKDKNFNVILKYNWLISYYNKKIQDLFFKGYIDINLKSKYYIYLEDIY